MCTEPKPCRKLGCRHIINDLSDDAARKFFKKTGVDSRVEADKYWNCVLKTAGENGMTLEKVGNVMGITRERVRQIERRAFEKIAYGRVLARHEAALIKKGIQRKSTGRRVKMLRECVETRDYPKI